MDRWIGAALVALALAVAVTAGGYEVGFVVDPLGPRALPYLVSGLFLVGGGVLVLRRISAPQVAAGPAPQPWRSQALALAILVAYAITLPVLGFVAGTAVASGALSKVFGGRFLPGLGVGLLFGVGLFSLFALGFGLELPVGVMFGQGP